MARTLVIGDIHAAQKALVQVLERADLQADDELIFLGDYVDAWSEAVETVDFLQKACACSLLGFYARSFWLMIFSCSSARIYRPVFFAIGSFCLIFTLNLSSP